MRARLRVALGVTVLCALLIAACATPTSSATSTGRVRVVVTMSVFADFAEHVGGEHVDVTTIVPVGGDPHTYQPTPADAIALSDADVVLDNGLGLSPWFETLKSNVDGVLVTLTDDIAEEAVRTSGKIDPHMWMVPDFVMSGYVDAIEDALVTVDPDNARDYSDLATAYRSEISELDDELATALATIPSDRAKLVTSHDAYSYFAAHYQLEIVGTITGVTTEEEPSAQAIQELIDRIRAEDVPAVFFETTINPALAETVARDAGVVLGDPLYGDSVGEPGTPQGDYAGMMRANVEAIVAALAGPS